MTEIYGHRGAAAYAPENTIPSFKLAIGLHADAVEFDVQMTSDHQLVVIHDETLDRTTDGSGPVKSHTLAQLKALDACAGKTDFRQARIPTLDEVLELLVPTKLRLNVELKNSEVEYPGLEEKAVEAVRRHGLERRVVFSTFNHYSLRLLEDMGVGPLGCLYQDILFRPWRYVAALGVEAVHPPAVAVFGKRYVRKCHEAGLYVRPWVVNGKAELRRLMRWGVDAVFTDAPDVAMAVRDDLAAEDA
ncbi:MAG: glycerophosphodiester phosphodiesterase [Propionibacteriaceae bacterium]|nr:glycerophosphodiester phosphodiesterase [Propionibacteriaceae bacterium]